MLLQPAPRFGRGFQTAVGGLILLSLAAVSVSVWILLDFGREQEIVANLLLKVPPGALAETRELAGDLRLQSRLLLVVILNLVVTGMALGMLLRTLRSSERSLRDVKGLASDILESMDQGVLTTDRDGKITSINRLAYELLELNGDPFQRHLDSLDPQHARLGEMQRHVLKTRQVVRDQDYAVTIRGHARSLRWGCSPLRNADGVELGSVIHLRDLTERLLLEERMRRMERHMGLGSLATGLHHEIKNPLSALSLHVQLLEESLAERNTTEEINETIGVLKTEVRRIARVLESFRDYAALSELNRELVDVANLLRVLERLLAPEAKYCGVEVRVAIPPSPLPPIDVDAVKLQQVLINLCLNAFQAMPHGGVLTITPRTNDSMLEIDVHDTGVGIHPSLHEKLFDPYFTTRGEGTGMGLALCEKIVRLHAGTIHFHCSDAGTVFTVSLPYHQSSAP